MTLVIPAGPTRAAATRSVRRPSRAWPRRTGLALLLLATALLYLVGLGASGWANAFYSAAVQAGSSSWTAMFFGSSDAANAITVDKTPAALWVMDLSARLFGFNPWSVLVPQALMGVASVALLAAAVRRVAGPGAGLLAAAVLAATPVAALIFRFDNPDALLVLLLVAAAYCTQRACEPGASRGWLIAAGVAVGFGFLAKMLQALLVLPALAGAYLLAGHRPLRSRIVDAAAAAVAVVVSAGWYLLAVELWPASARPYIGGSQDNSIVGLTLGYNGLGRLTGDEPGGLGNLNFDVGWGRLLGYTMGSEIGWLLPAAIVCLVAGVVLTRRAPRTDPTRAALIIWGGWLAITAVVFSYMNGIVHAYYTVALAPAIGAVLGIGVTLLWRCRADPRAATTLAGVVLLTTVVAAVLLAREEHWLPWLRGTVAVAGVGAAVLMLVAARLPDLARRAAACLAIAACLAGPVAMSVATAATSHSGAIPSVGPAHGGGAPFAGMFGAPTPGDEVVDLLATNADRYTWAAAVVGSTNAAGYQLAAGAAVMAVGGFNGTDPFPTLDRFVDDVARGRIHYFIKGSVMPGRPHAGSGADTASDADQITSWVRANFTATSVDGTVLYDLTQPRAGSQVTHSEGQR